MNKLEGKVAVITAAVEQIGKNVNGVQGDVSNLAYLDRSYATVKEQKGSIEICSCYCQKRVTRHSTAIKRRIYSSIIPKQPGKLVTNIFYSL